MPVLSNRFPIELENGVEHALRDNIEYKKKSLLSFVSFLRSSALFADFILSFSSLFLFRSISGQFPFFFSVTINLVLYFPFCFSFSTESRGKGKTSRSKEGAIGTSVERRPRGENLSVES